MPQRRTGKFPDHPLPTVQNKKPDDVKETEMHFYLRRQGASKKFQKVWGSLREEQVFTGDDNPNQVLEAQGDGRHFKRRVGIGGH